MHHELTDEQRLIFYSSWLYLAIWICTSIEDGQRLAQIAERFHITPKKASEILSFLVQTGICYEESGIYRMGKVHVHVGTESTFMMFD